MHLAAYAECLRQVVQLVAVETEMAASNLQCVDSLVVRRWLQLSKYEAGIGFLNVEGIAIVRDDDVSLIEYLPKSFYELSVVGFVALVTGEIWQCFRIHTSLAEPLDRKREEIRFGFKR